MKSMGKDETRANYYKNKGKEVGMDWPYSSEACDKYNETGTWLVPSRKEESGKAKTKVSKECGGRVEGNRN